MALYNKSVVISKLFDTKCFRPKTLLYFAYKCAKCNSIDIGSMATVLSNINFVLDKFILSCEESFGLSVHYNALKLWDWSVAKSMPNSLFLTLMDVNDYEKVIGNNLEDTMQVYKNYYFKDRRIRQPNGINLIKICNECFNNEDTPDNFTYLLDSTTFVEDIEEFLPNVICNDREYWCQQCYTMPLFTLHSVYNRLMKRRYSSSSDDYVGSFSKYVKHPKSSICLDEQ